MYNIDRAREISDARQIEAIHADAPELSAQDEADLLEGYVLDSVKLSTDKKLDDIGHDITPVLALLSKAAGDEFESALNHVHALGAMRGDV